jgi:hypothetical protein
MTLAFFSSDFLAAQDIQQRENARRIASLLLPKR